MSESVPQIVIMYRNRVFVNTDPQRRCYDGCFYSYEYVWGGWEILEFMRIGASVSECEARLEWWRELNKYAVSSRGRSAESEFRLEEYRDECEAIRA